MQRPTLGDVRRSMLAQNIGICTQNIAGIAAVVNDAQERLLQDPLAPDEGWWGGYATMVFNVQVSNFQGFIVTPREVARLIAIDVCTRPVRIRNAFYEYLEFGSGLQPKFKPTCGQQVRQAYERDNVVTFAALSSPPVHVRVYATDPADVGKSVRIQGKDQNSMTVLDVDQTTQQAIQGESIDIASPFATSLNTFSEINGIQKDLTVGDIQYFQVDSNGNETPLSVMQPGETESNYRRYFLNHMPIKCQNTASGTIQVTAQVKLDLVPAMSDSDYLLIQSIPALVEECQAVNYSRMDSSNAPQLEAKHHAKAIQLLNGQMDHFLGKWQTSVSVKLFGSDRLRQQAI